MGISTPSVYDIEDQDEELWIYSTEKVRLFCDLVGISPLHLFDITVNGPVLTPDDLVVLIQGHCRSNGMTVEQFEQKVGWLVRANFDAPPRFLIDYSLEAIRDLCIGLGVEWGRFLSGH